LNTIAFASGTMQWQWMSMVRQRLAPERAQAHCRDRSPDRTLCN
jgi:hypothetical protein